jgi:hypothetical protein
MPAVDRIHDPVKNALVKDGWTITHDPFVIQYDDLQVIADLAAERTLAAERGQQRIAAK